MQWTGIAPYEAFIQKLMPGAATLQKNQPQEFRAAQASVPFTNTPSRASSTFVRNIRYLPQSKVAFVRLGNQQYWYAMTPEQLSRWLNSRSLGQHYNNYVKL